MYHSWQVFDAARIYIEIILDKTNLIEENKTESPHENSVINNLEPLLVSILAPVPRRRYPETDSRSRVAT